MSFPSSHPLFIAAVTIFAVIVLMWTGKIWARRQVTRWCEREGYELVSWRGACSMKARARGTWCHPFSRKVRVEWD